MATVTLRNTKGSALTFTEMDDNFTNLNTDKLENLSEDSTPQLGADLDVNGNKIISASNGDIDIEPNGTGNVLLGNFTFDADQTVGAGQDDYVLTYDHSAGTISLEAASGGGLSNIVEDTTPQLGGNLDAQSNNITNLGTLNTHTIPGGTGTFALTSQLGISNVVEDTTPQLGGDLDLNSSDITGTGDIDITGSVVAQSSLQTQTGTTYTAVLGDASKLITMNNASANTLTIPQNSSVAYPVGTKLDIAQLGAGQTTVAEDSNVTIRSTPTLKLRAQYSGATCIKIATNEWILVGDLAES